MTIEELLTKLSPIIGEKANRLWLLYNITEDLEKRRELEGIVHSLAARHLNQCLCSKEILLPPPDHTNESGFLIGKAYYGDEERNDFFLSEDELLQHLIGVGATGTGKTNFIFSLLKQLLEKSIPFLVFSWKREYRDLPMTGWNGSEKIEVYTVGRDIAPFAFNPFRPPPGIRQDEWNFKAIDVLSHAYFLGHGVRYLLHSIVNGIDHPSISSMLESLKKMKAVGRKRQWLDSAIRTAGDLCIGPSQRAFKTNGIEIESLLDRYVVFELDSLSEDAKTFFVEALLAWIHQYRLGFGKRERLLHVNVIEEAHHVLLKRKEYLQEKETVMDVIFRELRELGEALVVCDQHPSMISKPALGNTGTTLLFRLKHFDDVKAGADSVLLDYNQRQYVGELQTGWAIAKYPIQPSPFLIKIPLVTINKGTVTDEFLKERFLGYSAQSRVIPPQQAMNSVIPPIPAEDKREFLTDGKPSEAEIQLLMDVVACPTSGVVERYRRLGLSIRKGNSIKENLIHKHLAEEKSMPIGKGAIKYLQITQQGWKVFGELGNDVRMNFSQKLGGPEHRYWVDKIADELKGEGFDVEKESTLRGKTTADLVARKNGRSFAIEVETGKSNEPRNMEKNLEAGFDLIIVVGTSEKEREKLLEELKRKAGERDSARLARRAS